MKTKDEFNDLLTYRIIGCALKVHSILGNGFQELIYQRALGLSMRKEKLDFQRELEMKIFFEENHIGTRRVDFLVEGSVMVELKAVSRLDDVHLAQGLNYLKAFKLDKGLLINFGARSLEVKRLRHPRKGFVHGVMA